MQSNLGDDICLVGDQIVEIDLQSTQSIKGCRESLKRTNKWIRLVNKL